MSRARSRSAFTLIELLVAVAIIAVLLAMLLAAVQKARFAALVAASTNNLKQVALGALLYHDTNNRLPFNGLGPVGTSGPTNSASAGNLNSGSWAYQILPYVEQQPLYQSQTGTAPATWGANLAVFSCPIRARAGYVSGTAAMTGSGPTTTVSVAAGASYTFPVGASFTVTGTTSHVRNSDGSYTYTNLNSTPGAWSYYLSINQTIPASGPVTDYGLNYTLNSALGSTTANSVNYSDLGKGLSSITDGTSNTVLVGHQYVATADYQATTPDNTKARVSIFVGGTYATARGGTTFMQDGTTNSTNAWGSPMKEGGLMAMADGSVHLFPYTTTLTNFINPRDGATVTLPDD